MRTWVIALGLACGCYHPSFEQNVPCAADLSCPGSEICDTSHAPPVCVDQLGSDAAPDGAVQMDGAVSACGVCANPMPVCDTSSTTCRACYNDGECGSDVCSEWTGLCVAEPDALYVKNGGNDAGTCTRTQPCSSITRALALVDATRFTIKVFDGNYHDAFVTSLPFVLSGENDGNNAHVFFRSSLGLPHLLESDGGTSLVEEVILDGGRQETVRVQGGATMTMYQVEVLDSPIGAIDMKASSVMLAEVEVHDSQGAEAAINQTDGDLTVERAVVYAVTGPCVKTQGKYLVENSFLVGCGAEGFMQVGAIASTQVFQFNTVANNSIGAVCGIPTTIKNTIFAGNGATSPQISPLCAATYSLFTDTAPNGAGNISNGNPAFVASDDDHITFQSGARDKADPAATLTFDFDGEPRPHGLTSDIGADEHY
ncbi:MAG TPA: DUF1565 domain-containing protein [Kofleriaceae bacterium]|nr:DUF1565 domain-containing protein [Kofleriaceae bacterium]